ncbi:NUDIX domain-containing protein [Streptomyces sp. H10-C2]|uniref:NUDIX hydrolase n=1 Tax=unclassified Streptomyces TaxID=2593676 RepID=UPI0024BB5CAB|nr:MULTISPECIES: NUDIX hydrolase [unclassified Streptomyces]MDJ0342911.1 NUDIX domain-containing protein [Streptomyces sp. PH10-H1]MDJ0372685.1 NUDIX domain-containing protein [Streptomyces sp. H10-C2]
MIVWVNGAFGAGKTSAARELLDLLPGSTLYDPEVVGAGLGQLLPEKRLQEVSDLQDLQIWRRLVVDTAAALLQEVGGVLIVPMTLLRQEYRDELFGGLASRGIAVRHVLLDPGETILLERLARREEMAEDAADHLTAYLDALYWLSTDAYVIGTAGLTPRQTAERIAEALRQGVGRCDIVQTPEPAAETVASGVLLFDEQDRVLLVDPTYKPGWEFPGGVVERGEAPAQAGLREVAEELGIELAVVPRLLVVDWEPPAPPGFGGMRLLFDGGRIPAADADRLVLPGAELRGWRFVTEDEAAGLLPPVRLNRLRWALRARERGVPLNLEAGRPVE